MGFKWEECIMHIDDKDGDLQVGKHPKCRVNVSLLEASKDANDT